MNVELRMKFLDIKTRYEEQVQNIMHFTEEVLRIINATKKESYNKHSIDLSSEEEYIEESFRKLQASIQISNDQLWQYMNMVAVNLLILFEAFNKDFLLEVYQYRPELLKNNKKTLSPSQILNFDSMKNVIHFLARKKINRIGRRGLNWLKNSMEKAIKFEIPGNFPEWEDLKEFYDLRNIIVHNQSIMPEKYDEDIKTVDEDRTKIHLDQKSLEKYSNAIINYFNFVHEKMVYPEKKDK
jgi:uncharacterized protein (UPF0305 family)